MDFQSDITLFILNGTGHILAQLSFIIIAVVATINYIIHNENVIRNSSKCHEASAPASALSGGHHKTSRNVLATVDSKQTASKMTAFSTDCLKDARSEYRAILHHEDYTDLCKNELEQLTDVQQYVKPPRVKYATTPTWSASLESITEEEECTDSGGGYPVDSDSSSGTYATYINNINESPKILHAGKVWCITKSRNNHPEENCNIESEENLGYLETDIDNVSVNYVVEDKINDFYNQHDQGYNDDLAENHTNEFPDPVLAVMPTPTYLLQGTAIPAAYPGHSQYLIDNSLESNHGNVDRPNFITTDGGNAEWSYSFPIESDVFASNLDQNHMKEPCDNTVSQLNHDRISSTNSGPVTLSNQIEKQPILREENDLNNDSMKNIQINKSQIISAYDKNVDIIDSHLLSENNEVVADESEQKITEYNLKESEWVETFASSFVLPVPDLSPTIHLEDIPMGNPISKMELTRLYTENLGSSYMHPDGLIETDIDFPALDHEEVLPSIGNVENISNIDNVFAHSDEDEDVGIKDQLNSENNEVQYNADNDKDIKEELHIKLCGEIEQPDLGDGIRNSKISENDVKEVGPSNEAKGPKSKRFMDKFRKSDSTEIRDLKERDKVQAKEPKEKGVRNLTNKVKKFRLSGKKKRKKKMDQEEILEIDDDEDMTTLHLSDEEEEDGGDEEAEVGIEDSKLNENITTKMETDLQSSQTYDSERELPQSRPNSSNVSQYSRRSTAGGPSVRLLCCQAPKLRTSGSDPYMASNEQTDRISGRQSNVTEITELIANSSGDDLDYASSSLLGPEYINGIELEPGQLHDLLPEKQTEIVAPETNELIEKRSTNIQPSICLTPPKISQSPITFEKLDKEFKVPIATCDDTSDINGSNRESANGSLHENGSIIEPKGFAGENKHSFYLVGTPGNVTSLDDAIKQKESIPNQATSSDMYTKDKQTYTNLDNKVGEPLSYTNNNTTLLLTHNQSALHHVNYNEPDQSLTNYPSEILSEDVNTDSLLNRSDSEQVKCDRIQELLTEFRADETKYQENKQSTESISNHTIIVPSKPLSDVIIPQCDPILCTEQDVAQQKAPQVQTPDSEAFENNSVVSFASDASTRASLIIAEQRAKVRKSLRKLNLPDWYKKSSHYNKTLKDEHVVDYPDYVSEPRFVSCSPTAGGSDWSMDTTGTGSSCGVTTKLSFLSEARYKRAYHNYDRYYKHFPTTDRPIRTAFSCVELPGRTNAAKEPDTKIEPEECEKYHSSDALLSMNENESIIRMQQASALQSSPYHKSTPNLSPSRLRSRSAGESYDASLNALSIKRMERKTNDTVFYITGRVDENPTNDGVSELVSPGDDSGFNDSYEPPSISRYEIKQAHIQPTEYVRPKQTPPSELIKKHATSSYYSKPFAIISSPPSKPPRHSPETHVNSFTKLEEPKSYQFVPITSAQDEVPHFFPEHQSGTPKYGNVSAPLSAAINSSNHGNSTIRPDPRYKSDGSRNEKISPFPMVTPFKDKRSVKHWEGSPRRKRCNVRITITDTSLDSTDDEILLQEPVSEDLQYPSVHRPKSPIGVDDLKESNFAAVLSVVTSSSNQNTSSRILKPPPEVSMEEIVDSLLGLSSNSRSPSPADLHAPDNEMSFSGTSAMNLISDQEQNKGHMRSSSLDSLFSDDGVSPLNSIILKNSGEEDSSLNSSSKQSTPMSVQDAIGDEIVMVKCRYKKCGKVKELDEARKTYKTCHNCYTYYCSRDCRLAHWEKHKKKCLYSRTNSAAKQVIYHSRYNENIQDDLSKIARTGYLSRGRGAILLIFPDVDSAEGYMTFGMECMPFPPTYATIKELKSSGVFGDHLEFLIQMCRTYDPDIKFVLNVAIMSCDESSSKTLPRKQAQSIKKCAKVRLSMMHTQSRQLPSKDRETLILTAPPGVAPEGALDKKSRQICFIHIQRQLRQRGVSLRHQHPEIYDQLCRWVEYHEHFVPVTIYPREGGTGPRFMCVLMPDSDPNDFGWANNPNLLDSIDLDAELEKLENVLST